MHGSPDEHARSGRLQGQGDDNMLLELRQRQETREEEEEMQTHSQDLGQVGTVSGEHASPGFRNTMHTVTREARPRTELGLMI